MNTSYLHKVQRGIDYIENNLEYTITPERVASEAGISRWHFQRIFKALTNETLKTYIRSRRLSNSLGQLLNSDEKILDIALRAGFESQESFTRAFKKAFDVTPNEYRKIGNKALFLKKIKFDTEYLRHINENISLSPEFYQQKPMLLVGMKTCFYGEDSEKNNMADKLPPLWGQFLSRLKEVPGSVPGVCYGVVSQAHEQSDELQYFAAIEVEEVTDIPDGMDTLDFPGGNYARFTHCGKAEKLNDTVNFIYSSWLMSSGKMHTYSADLEVYGSEYHPTSESSIIYYAIPVDE